MLHRRPDSIVSTIWKLVLAKWKGKNSSGHIILGSGNSVIGNSGNIHLSVGVSDNGNGGNVTVIAGKSKMRNGGSIILRTGTSEFHTGLVEISTADSSHTSGNMIFKSGSATLGHSGTYFSSPALLFH